MVNLSIIENSQIFMNMCVYPLFLRRKGVETDTRYGKALFEYILNSLFPRNPKSYENCF